MKQSKAATELDTLTDLLYWYSIKKKFIQRWPPTIRATFKCRAMKQSKAATELDTLTDLGSIVRFYHYLKRAFSKH